MNMTSGDVIGLLFVLGTIIIALYVMYSDRIHGRGCGGCSGKCHAGCSCGSPKVITAIEDEKQE